MFGKATLSNDLKSTEYFPTLGQLLFDVELRFMFILNELSERKSLSLYST